MAVVVIAAAGMFTAYSYMSNKEALFFVSTVALAAALLFLCGNSSVHHSGPARTVAQSLLFVAILLPVADRIHSWQRRQAPPASNEKPAPAYSFRAAKGNPAAFQAWWQYYVNEWATGAERAVEMPDPKGILPLVLKPNAEAKFFESTVRINNLGFRGPDISPQKKADRVRIVTLGESPTFGPTLRSGDRPWPEILQNKIDNRLSCSHPIEVINAGTPAYDIKDNLT